MLIYEDVRGSKDENGNYTEPNGKIDASDDQVRISKRASNPYNSNLNLNFVWKQFQLNATFTGEWGAYRMMNSDLYGESFGSLETTNVSKMWEDMFIYEDVLDASGNVIAKANKNGRWPNFGYTEKSINSQRSTFWRISAARLYLRNITLAYTLPKNIVKKFGMNNVRLNATCQNALNFYNPYPDGVWNDFAGNYGRYPVVRKITFGINVTF